MINVVSLCCDIIVAVADIAVVVKVTDSIIVIANAIFTIIIIAFENGHCSLIIWPRGWHIIKTGGGGVLIVPLRG